MMMLMNFDLFNKTEELTSGKHFVGSCLTTDSSEIHVSPGPPGYVAMLLLCYLQQLNSSRKQMLRLKIHNKYSHKTKIFKCFLSIIWKIEAVFQLFLSLHICCTILLSCGIAHSCIQWTTEILLILVMFMICLLNKQKK